MVCKVYYVFVLKKQSLSDCFAFTSLVYFVFYSEAHQSKKELFVTFASLNEIHHITMKQLDTLVSGNQSGKFSASVCFFQTLVIFLLESLPHFPY